ncbi:methylated-DNA--[protein]-cysteine S-methyltransferase [Methylacidimicrobium tartarophylax]|uniref:methylated-DNA--[protein]-cysteine S-methyltransferase n=1 Tax=Methylacidimicrobium tartarophylax TaxID=1041768 RepID=A0A5E6MBA3_9BACT|nr:methylated-DNA--[protein]-cysteine S-methyltransferase [Methylacidimicrobium tartarophylax]VVM06695.1 Methylated-DNA--protein-cysteine methyltransferase, inducible [Methylacidimicrobium tartarophylax]
MAAGSAGLSGKAAVSPLLVPAPGRGSLCEQEIDTPLGTMVGIADSAGLRLLQFADASKLPAQRVRIVRWVGLSPKPRPNKQLKALETQLAEYFAGKRLRFSIAIAPIGTSWQLSVWHRLLHYGPGKTVFYKDLARSLGRPQAARAVGSAVGANPIPILVPCHRVVPQAGSLGGYTGRPWRKQRLLSLETAADHTESTTEE